MSKVFFITGAGRGLGTDIARAALAAGHQVVATGRNPANVLEALGGEQDNLLAAALDITDLDAAYTSVDAAVARFGRIDVLINNAPRSRPATSRRSPLSRCAGRSRRTSSVR